MRISVIFVLFGLIIIVRGWVTFLQPIALTLGAMLTALNIDLDLIPDIQPIELRNLFSKDTDDDDMCWPPKINGRTPDPVKDNPLI